MKYKKLGSTGMRVSRVCLGALDFGGMISEEDSIRVIRSALDQGINFIDTADVYQGGRSEEIIGKAIKGDRHSVVIASKVGGKVGPGINDRGLSRKHIMKAVEDSLKRLQTDYIDVYYLHNPDPGTPLEETLAVLDDLVYQGKVRYIGCCNYTVWELSKMLRTSDLNGWARVSAVQFPYNLLARDAEVEMMSCCESEGLGICAYSPLASGLLSGRHEFGKRPTDGRLADEKYGKKVAEFYWNESNFKAIDRFKEIAAECHLTMPQFAVAWLLNNDAVTSAIVGATASTEKLKEICSIVEAKLPPEALEACEEVWGMFRPRRHHYARDGKLRKI